MVNKKYKMLFDIVGVCNIIGAVVQNVMNVSLQQERYAQSLIIRKKIEAKIKSGTSAPRDLKNFQFHTNIIEEYERNNRANKQYEKPMSAEERQKMQRYKSALGIVLKYQKTKQSQMSDEERRLYVASKAIVDTYEQSTGRKGGAAQSAWAKFERTKNELIKQAKKDYPFKFVLSGAARKKKRSLMDVGIDMEEARYIALHSSAVVSDLIDLKKKLPKKVVDKSKQLVAYNAPGARQQPAKAVVKQNGPNKAKPTVAAAKAAPEPKKTAAEILAKKLKAGCRSAKKVLLKHENSDIDKLTDKEKAIIRISLRRLRTYNQAEGKPVETTRFDALLNDDPKKEATPKATTAEVVAKAGDGGAEEKVEDEVAAEEEAEANAEEGEQECEYNPEEEVDADADEDAAQPEQETKEE